MSGRGVVMVLVVLGVISGWGTWRWISARNAAIERVGVYQSRFTLTEDHGEDLGEVQGASSPTVFYRVTLKDAPLGQKLSMHCDWIDPRGQVAQRRNYETLTITSESWKTHCKAEFGPASKPGIWAVEMYVLKRQISRSSIRLLQGDKR